MRDPESSKNLDVCRSLAIYVKEKAVVVSFLWAKGKKIGPMTYVIYSTTLLNNRQSTQPWTTLAIKTPTQESVTPYLEWTDGILSSKDFPYFREMKPSMSSQVVQDEGGSCPKPSTGAQNRRVLLANSPRPT